MKNQLLISTAMSAIGASVLIHEGNSKPEDSGTINLYGHWSKTGKCPVCNRPFKTYDGVQRHLIGKHAEKGTE